LWAASRDLHDEPDFAERWQKAADEIHADILADGLDERVFVQHYDDTTALEPRCC
jgi:GH15 family glucan-1,4-alpha-glucosidase